MSSCSRPHAARTRLVKRFFVSIIHSPDEAALKIYLLPSTTTPADEPATGSALMNAERDYFRQTISLLQSVHQRAGRRELLNFFVFRYALLNINPMSSAVFFSPLLIPFRRVPVRQIPVAKCIGLRSSNTSISSNHELAGALSVPTILDIFLDGDSALTAATYVQRTPNLLSF